MKKMTKEQKMNTIARLQVELADHQTDLAYFLEMQESELPVFRSNWDSNILEIEQKIEKYKDDINVLSGIVVPSVCQD